MSRDLVPEALVVLERVMLGQPGYGSLHIVRTELERLNKRIEVLEEEKRQLVVVAQAIGEAGRLGRLS